MVRLVAQMGEGGIGGRVGIRVESRELDASLPKVAVDVVGEDLSEEEGGAQKQRDGEEERQRHLPRARDAREPQDRRGGDQQAQIHRGRGAERKEDEQQPAQPRTHDRSDTSHCAVMAKKPTEQKKA